MRNLAVLPAGSSLFIGLDLSKRSWHVIVRAGGRTALDFNCAAQPRSLSPLLAAARQCRIASVYEAGPFGYGLHDWLVTQGVQSMVCSPGQVPVEVSNRVKTDRRDALKLATMLEAGLLRPIAIPTPSQRADRELVRQRDRLVRRRRAAMARIRGFLLTYGVTSPSRANGPWRPTFLSWLDHLRLDDPVLEIALDGLRRDFTDADARLADHTVVLRCLADAPRHAAMVALLSTAPGIGWLTALNFAVEIFDWSRFPSGEAFSAYLGLTPSQYSSGARIHHGTITRSGNCRLRSMLVESCWTALRADAGLRAAYEAIRPRRGPKRAIVALARRMCHRLLAMVRTGVCYRLQAA